MLTVMTSPLTSEIASLKIVIGFGELPGVVVAQDDSLSVGGRARSVSYRRKGLAVPLLESVSHFTSGQVWFIGTDTRPHSGATNSDRYLGLCLDRCVAELGPKRHLSSGRYLALRL